MQPQAKVSSIDAVDAFRSSLILYLERARHVLDDVQHDITQQRAWLQHDRLPFWKRQVHLFELELAQAEQELLTARLSGQTEAVRDRRRTVERAKAKLDQATETFGHTRRWLSQFDHAVDPQVKRTAPLRQVLDHDLVKAVALLAETMRVLVDYAAVSVKPASGTVVAGESAPEAPAVVSDRIPAGDEGGRS
jgi:hypothetical protein